MQIVNTRDAATLLLINNQVAPGTIIDIRRREGLLTIVDPVTGNHRQHVLEGLESLQNQAETNEKLCVEHQIPSYLDEFMWRELRDTEYPYLAAQTIETVTITTIKIIIKRP